MPFPKDGFLLMLFKKTPIVVFFALGFFSSPAVFSQQNPDSLNDRTALDSLRAIYLSRIGESSPFYNGVQYIRDGRPATGFPFYGTDSLQKGDVTLIGFTHPDIDLYYDLVSDDLVAENFNRSGLFRVPRATVTGFRLGADHFVHLQPDSAGGSPLREGYFEYIPAGPLTLLIRWQKALETRPGYEDPAYKTYSYYYVQKGNGYFQLDGKKSLLKLLEDKEEAVKKFIRSEDLNFKKDPKSAYTKTLRFYVGLKY